MPGYDHEPDRAWDEYEWERFLQQQDHKTEKYMELLEKYLDHPQRDQIIAREMGWTQLLNGDDWTDEVDAMLAEESSAEDAEDEAEAETDRRRRRKLRGPQPLPRGVRAHRLDRSAFRRTTPRCKTSRPR